MEQQQGGQKRRMSAAARRFQGLVRPPPPQRPIKCPRCDSMNTKFCYYNNYSLSQPRHFCKACRRYWTQGGACRNIPVGGTHGKRSYSKANKVVESPIVVSSSSTISVETPLHSNIHPMPAVANSRGSAMPPQSAGGCMLPSYSSANDGLLSSVIASIPSLNYPQDTFSGQQVVNNQLSDVVNSLGTNLGLFEDFDVANLMVSSLNDYGQQLQPTQSFHQDLYTLAGMNTLEVTHQNGGMNSSGGIIGGSSSYPNNDLSFSNISGYGYSSNNYW